MAPFPELTQSTVHLNHSCSDVFAYALFQLALGVLSIYHCRKMDDAWYLNASLDKECFTSTHFLHLTIGTVFLATYLIGLPLVLMLLIKSAGIPELYRHKLQMEMFHGMCVPYIAYRMAGLPSVDQTQHLSKQFLAEMHLNVCSKGQTDMLHHPASFQSAQPSLCPYRSQQKTCRKQRLSISQEALVGFKTLTNDSVASSVPRSFTSTGIPTHREMVIDGSSGVSLYISNDRDIEDDLENMAGAKLTTEQLVEALVAEAPGSSHKLASANMRWDSHSTVPNWHLSQTQLREKAAINTLGMVLTQYNPRFYWFEVAECYFKLLHCGVARFTGDSESHKLVLSSCLFFAMLVVHTTMRPMASARAHVMKVCAIIFDHAHVNT